MAAPRVPRRQLDVVQQHHRRRRRRAVEVELAVLEVEQLPALGVKKVFIQPGAESADILEYCKKEEIEVFQGCVMVELGKAGH